MLFLLFNPIMFFEEFFMHIMSGNSLLGGEWGKSAFSQDEVGILTYALSRGTLWMFVSAACILLVSFLFMFAAAWNVNPMHSVSGRKRGKRKGNV